MYEQALKYGANKIYKFSSDNLCSSSGRNSVQILRDLFPFFLKFKQMNVTATGISNYPAIDNNVALHSQAW